MKYDEFDRDKVHSIQRTVEDDSKQIEEIVQEIIRPYCKELDRYVSFIRDVLADGQNPPTDQELDDFCLNLSTDIYFASGMCEQLGIRDDISNAVFKEVYHTARDSEASGTVADKNSIAELKSQQEQLTNICYNRAYKIMKAKVDSAQELLSSCKKVLTRRMNEYNLTHMVNQ